MNRTLIACCLLSLCSIGGSAAAQNNIKQIQRQETRWVDRLTRGNVDELAAMYDDQAILTLPGEEPIVGRVSIRATLKSMISALPNLQLTTTSVLPLSADFQVENGVGHYEKAAPTGAPQSITIHYQVLWKCRRNKPCVIIRDMVSE